MHTNLTYQNVLAQRHPVSVGARLSGTGSGGWLRRLLQSVNQRIQRRKAIIALEDMDEWLLRDIGITRMDIPHVVDGFDHRELALAPRARPVGIHDEIYRMAA